MIYVVGPLNGDYKKYIKMLKKLNPGKEDSVYFMGDVLCGEKGGIAILQHMMTQSNFIPIVGDDEIRAQDIFPCITRFSNTQQAIETFQGEDERYFWKFILSGGRAALDDFLALDNEGRQKIIDYLFSFKGHAEVTAAGRSFVLCHGGINGGYDEKRSLDDYDDVEFAFAANAYSRPVFPDRHLISAAFPTYSIDECYANKVYSKKGHLLLNCFTPTNHCLAAVCLDKLKVYYV